MWCTGVPRNVRPIGIDIEFCVPPREDLPPKAPYTSWLWTSIPLCIDSTSGSGSHNLRHIIFPLPEVAYGQFDFIPLSLETTQEPGATDSQFSCSNPEGLLSVQRRIKQISITTTPVGSDGPRRGRKRAFDVVLNHVQHDCSPVTGPIWCSYGGSWDWTQQDYDLIGGGMWIGNTGLDTISNTSLKDPSFVIYII